MHSVTYTLNRQPVAGPTHYDGASNSAKIMAEVFERLLEIDEQRHDGAASLVRRLATLADLSPSGFRIVMRFGSGDIGHMLSSYEDQARNRGVTRQAIHWQWAQDLKAISMCFPEVADLLREYRESVQHHEDALSAPDGLRRAMEDRVDERQ